MKIFLDTADVKAIGQWAQTGIIDGVTTNPTHLSREKGNPVQVIQEICSLFPLGCISVEVTEVEPEAVYAQAKRIAKLAPQVTVKIPCHIKYYAVIKKLVDEGVSLNITLVFSLIQGLAMCKLGVDYISPFIGRLEDINISGIKLVEELVQMRYTYGFDTEILAASIRTMEQLHDVVAVGADIATVPVAVLEKAVAHSLTDKGMQMFLDDWKKLGITQFP
jgi:transaldolase